MFNYLIRNIVYNIGLILLIYIDIADIVYFDAMNHQPLLTSVLIVLYPLSTGL